MARKSVVTCSERDRENPNKPCPKPVLAKDKCRYHYDKWRAGRIMEPINQSGVVPLGVVPNVQPETARLLRAREKQWGKVSLYATVNQVLNDWAKAQPDYIAPEAAAQVSSDLMALASQLASKRPECKCGKCDACMSRAVLEKARTPPAVAAPAS